MEGHFSTGQRPQWAVVPIEEEEEDIQPCSERDTSELIGA